MKISLILALVLLTACSSKIQQEVGSQKENGTVSERNLILAPGSLTGSGSENAAEIFDLGIAPSNGSSKVLLNISNTTSNVLTIDTNALLAKFSQAGKRFTIGSPNTCTGTIAASGSCRVQIVLNNNSTTVLEDYTQPVEANLITGAAPISTNPLFKCGTGFIQSGSTCIPTNPQFGKIIFTGQKAADVAISTVPLMSSLRLSTLADNILIKSGSVTKRYYMGNPLQTGNTIPVPTVIAPTTGSITKNTCTSLIGLAPLKACFFEVTYNYDISKPSLSESITFGTPNPLNGVSLDTTGASINLAITNQPTVIPVKAASFVQVSKIVDLSSSTQQERIYVTNTGSGVADLTAVNIPSPFVIAKTSCSTTQNIGSTCFIDLKVDTSKTTNATGIAPSISFGSSVAPVTAGQPVTPGKSGSCKPGFSFVNNVCVTSNVSQSCSITNGTGSQSSIDGGVTFASCLPNSCLSNYSISGSSCSPKACTVQNATNLSQAASVSGDLFSGCSITSCVSGFSLVSGNCASNTVIAPQSGNISQITIEGQGGTSIVTNNNEVITINLQYNSSPWDSITAYLNYARYHSQNIGIDGNPSIKRLNDNWKSCSLNFSGGSVLCSNGVVPGLDQGVVDFVLLSYGAVVCGLTTNNEVKCSTAYQGSNPTAVIIAGFESNVKSLPTINTKQYNGGNFCAIMNDNSVRCQKNNTGIDMGLSNVKTLYSGEGINCAVLYDGTGQCWGSNAGFKLGNTIGGKYGSSAIPVPILGVSNIKELFLITGTSFALLNDGTVMSWGSNFYHTLGRETNTTAYDGNLPALIPNLTNVKSLSGDGYQIFAVLNDGSAKGWGVNNAGELGNTSFENSNIPVQINGYYKNISGEFRSLVTNTLINVPSLYTLKSGPKKTINATDPSLLDVTFNNDVSLITAGSDDTGLTKKIIIYYGKNPPNDNTKAGQTYLVVPLIDGEPTVTFQVPNNTYNMTYRLVTTNSSNISASYGPSITFYAEADLPSPTINSINFNSSLTINLQDQNLQQFVINTIEVQFFDQNNNFINLIGVSPSNLNGQTLTINPTDLSTLGLGEGQNYIVAISLCSANNCYPVGSFSNTFTYVGPTVFSGTVSFNQHPLLVSAIFVTDFKWGSNPANPLTILDFSASDGSFIPQIADINSNSSLNIIYYDNNGTNITLPFDSTLVDSSNWLSAGSFVIEDSNCSINNMFNPALSQYKMIKLCGDSSNGFYMYEINWNAQSQGDGSLSANIGTYINSYYLPANVVYPDGSKKTYFIGSNSNKLYSIADDSNIFGLSGLSIIDEGVICSSAQDLSTSPAAEVSGGGGGMACIMTDNSKLEFPFAWEGSYYTTIPWASNPNDWYFTNYLLEMY